MAVTVAAFRARFPEFSDDVTYPDSRVEIFIEDSQLIYMGADEKRWSGKYDYAQAYLVAHLLITAEASEAGDSSVKVGPVSSKSAGGVSVTRAVATKDRSDGDDFYMGTVYGQRFLMIRNACFAGVLVANKL
jgi:hypothetical protein